MLKSLEIHRPLAYDLSLTYTVFMPLLPWMLVTFYWMSEIVDLILWNTGYSYIPISILELFQGCD
jgi:hypothetical protein